VARRKPDPLSELAETIEVVTGKPPTSGQMAAIERYVGLLVTWNRSQRLTGPRDAAGIISQVIRDAVLYLSAVPRNAARGADLGSGAGVPGIPIQIMRPGLEMMLVEAKAKRVSFLSTVKRELELGQLRVVHARAEELIERDETLRGAFDVVVSRCVGIRFLKTAAEYLRPGGVYVSGAAPDHRPGHTAGGPMITETRRVAIPRIRVDRTFVVASRDLRST
jgi:16S rRNA (guanine527-N7)-methyltransferase